jgi:iron complex outermembrane receptor protein
LNPEQIVSYEAEYQGWYLNHTLRLRAALFFNHLSDLIAAQQVSPTAVMPVNGSEADVYGGEVGFEWLAAPWLTLFGNYAHQEVGQTFTEQNRRSAPRSKVNAGARGEWENGLSAEILFHHVGAVTYPLGASLIRFGELGLVQPQNPRVGSYNLLNLRAGYRFWQQRAAAGHMREAEVAISAFNALNDKHKEHPLGDIISSRVMGWLTVKF